MDGKLLIALQFWKGDCNQAFRLADLLTDLETEHSNQADFLLVSRFDCPHNLDLIKRISRKFNVHHFVSRRRGTGWPVGCNELWLATMEWVTCMRAGGKIPRYKAVFTFEADNAPLMRGWINHFSHHWDLEYARKQGKLSLMGFLHPMGPHINGNCLVSLDPAITTPLLKAANRCPAYQGWDYYIAGEARRLGWAKMPGLLSVWNTKTVNPEDGEHWIKEGFMWVHGVKDDSLMNFARKKLLQ